MRTYGLSALAHLALVLMASMAFNATFLFGNRWLFLTAAGALSTLAVLPLAARWAFRGLRELGSKGQAPLWALPLGQMAGCICIMIGTLWVPTAFGRPDAWRDWLDVSPGPMTDFVVLLSVAVLGSALMTFILLCVEWVGGGMAHTAPRHDPKTRTALWVLGAILALMLALSFSIRTENLDYTQAWFAWSWHRDAGRALELFRRVADRPGGGRLADNALLRVALISREVGNPHEAGDALRQLRERFPGSPLADDACFWLGLAASASGDTEAARREFEALVKSWPESYLADDALVRLLELARQRGDGADQARLSGALLGRYRWGYVELESESGRIAFEGVPAAVARRR